MVESSLSVLKYWQQRWTEPESIMQVTAHCRAPAKLWLRTGMTQLGRGELLDGTTIQSGYQHLGKQVNCVKKSEGL
eukprot:361612-Chlamydomonas_euryale.AAC.22